MFVDCTIHGCTKWMLHIFFRPELKQLDPFLMLDYFSGTYMMLTLFSSLLLHGESCSGFFKVELMCTRYRYC